MICPGLLGHCLMKEGDVVIGTIVGDLLDQQGRLVLVYRDEQTGGVGYFNADAETLAWWTLGPAKEDS